MEIKDVKMVGSKDLVAVKVSEADKFTSNSYNRDKSNIVILLYNLGYIMFYRKEETIYFIKQDKILNHYKQPENLSLKCKNNIYYGIRNTPQVVKKIIVTFQSMPQPKNIYSDSMYNRFLHNTYSDLPGMIGENTLIVSVFDLFFQVGAFFVDNETYPDIQKNINLLILELIATYNLEKEDVLLYGASKGATGALNVGVGYDYNFFIVDPIYYLEVFADLNREKWFYPHGIESKLVDLEKDYSGKGLIIVNEAVVENFLLSEKLAKKYPTIELSSAKEALVHAEIYKNSTKVIADFLRNNNF